jgi:hypothetical protein
VQEAGAGVEEAPVVVEWVREEVSGEWVGGGGREARGWRRRRWWCLSWGTSTVFPDNEDGGLQYAVPVAATARAGTVCAFLITL